jgi:hypothetical protein
MSTLLPFSRSSREKIPTLGLVPSSLPEAAAACIATLTPRQRQIMDLVLAGHPSKNIAADLKITQRTVENDPGFRVAANYTAPSMGRGGNGNSVRVTFGFNPPRARSGKNGTIFPKRLCSINTSEDVGYSL